MGRIYGHRWEGAKSPFSHKQTLVKKRKIEHHLNPRKKEKRERAKVLFTWVSNFLTLEDFVKFKTFIKVLEKKKISLNIVNSHPNLEKICYYRTESIKEFDIIEGLNIREAFDFITAKCQYRNKILNITLCKDTVIQIQSMLMDGSIKYRQQYFSKNYLMQDDENRELHELTNMDNEDYKTILNELFKCR